MPVAKKSAKARVSKKAVSPMPELSFTDSSCNSCNSLPVGSIELTALMLVLVFSLSAVLFTSVYALQTKNVEIAQLQAQVNSLPVTE